MLVPPPSTLNLFLHTTTPHSRYKKQLRLPIKTKHPQVTSCSRARLAIPQACGITLRPVFGFTHTLSRAMLVRGVKPNTPRRGELAIFLGNHTFVCTNGAHKGVV